MWGDGRSLTGSSVRSWGCFFRKFRWCGGRKERAGWQAGILDAGVNAGTGTSCDRKGKKEGKRGEEFFYLLDSDSIEPFFWFLFSFSSLLVRWFGFGLLVPVLVSSSSLSVLSVRFQGGCEVMFRDYQGPDTSYDKGIVKEMRSDGLWLTPQEV